MTSVQPLPRGVVMGTTCAVHRHRELVPLHVHHIFPQGEGGPDEEWNKITVCANGHYSIHALLDIFKKQRGNVPWIVQRRYGKKVREYAQRGYEEIIASK